MKKFIYILLTIILFIPFVVFGKEKDINMYLFYGKGCPHCAALEEYLNEFTKEHDNVKLYKYEVWYDEDNSNKYSEVHKLLNDTGDGIPYLIIGNNTITGYSEDVTQEKIKNFVTYYENTKYKDTVGIYLGLVEDNKDDESGSKYQETIEDINAPKKIKNIVKESPLFISAIIIGLVDGINPCAMWILLFLISLLLGMDNKKRKWILGITFLVSSAAVYFLFLISWLDLSIFLNSISYIRIGISIIAIIFGCYSIINFLRSLLSKSNDDGCEVVDSKSRKRIIKATRKIVKKKSFILALLGIILLACAVNIIELLCSLGLPVMFAQILALNNISQTGKIIYSLIYVLAFLLDDILIFFISMKAMEIKAISNKFGKYSHLIGGIIMLIIGILIIYKPEWLMFNF